MVVHFVRYLPAPLRSILTRMLRKRFGQALSLSAEDFRGRRVLILGPARTLGDDLAGLDVASFDVIVKMNNGLDTPVALPGSDPLRCDVLFHSLTRDARPVTAQSLSRAGVGLLVHRTPTRSSFLDTALAAWQFRGVVNVRHIAMADYDAMARRLGGASPTTGLMCCAFFLGAPVSAVAIAGFTFFATNYHAGYDDAVASDAQAVRRIAEKGHHAPMREIAAMGELIERSRERGVVVSPSCYIQQAIDGCKKRRA